MQINGKTNDLDSTTIMKIAAWRAGPEICDGITLMTTMRNKYLQAGRTEYRYRFRWPIAR